MISIIDNVKEPCGDSREGARKHDLLLLLLYQAHMFVERYFVCLFIYMYYYKHVINKYTW